MGAHGRIPCGVKLGLASCVTGHAAPVVLNLPMIGYFMKRIYRIHSCQIATHYGYSNQKGRIGWSLSRRYCGNVSRESSSRASLRPATQGHCQDCSTNGDSHHTGLLPLVTLRLTHGSRRSLWYFLEFLSNHLAVLLDTIFSGDGGGSWDRLAVYP